MHSLRCALLTGLSLVGLAAARAQEPAAVPGQSVHDPLAKVRAAVDPATSGWQSEVWNDRVDAQLKRLVPLFEHPEQLADAPDLAELCAPDLKVGPLRTAEVLPRALPSGVRVFVGEPAAEAGPDAHGVGAPALALALRELWGAHAGAHHAGVKFKVVSVEASDDGRRLTTRVVVLAWADPEGGFVQLNADWVCTWSVGAGEDDPVLLAELVCPRFEWLIGPPGGAQLFGDCSEAVLGASPAWSEQLALNFDQWLASLQSSVANAFEGHHGLAVADVDGDGLEDLYVCQSGALPNLLFLQNPDGSAREVAGAWGVDFLDLSSSALLVDLDGDGDRDLVVTVFPELLFLANEVDAAGARRFRLAASVVNPETYSLAAADYDQDGDLDLYACAYDLFDGSGAAMPLPYHDANNGLANVLLRNDGAEGGQWRFTDVTAEVGLDENNRRFSFAASWEDYDDDGDPDLYVANDFGRNNLYRNDGGRFRDVAAQAGVEDISAGMGVSWGDYDGDGLMDIYVSNMFSSAGNRIAFQRQFQAGTDDGARSAFQRHARGNSLFRNLGDGRFEDVSQEAGVTLGRWAWGASFCDFDNDGREDIFVPNGFVTSENSKDL